MESRQRALGPAPNAVKRSARLVFPTSGLGESLRRLVELRAKPRRERLLLPTPEVSQATVGRAKALVASPRLE